MRAVPSDIKKAPVRGARLTSSPGHSPTSSPRTRPGKRHESAQFRAVRGGDRCRSTTISRISSGDTNVARDSQWHFFVITESARLPRLRFQRISVPDIGGISYLISSKRPARRHSSSGVVARNYATISSACLCSSDSSCYRTRVCSCVCVFKPES